MTVQEILEAPDADLRQLDRRIAAHMITRFYNLPLRVLWRFTLLTTWERFRKKSGLARRDGPILDKWWQ